MKSILLLSCITLLLYGPLMAEEISNDELYHQVLSYLTIKTNHKKPILLNHEWVLGNYISASALVPKATTKLGSLIQALRSVAQGERIVVVAPAHLKQVPPSLVRVAASAALVHLGDDYWIGSMMDEILHGNGPIDDQQSILKSISQPSLIPYLIEGIRKERYHPFVRAGKLYDGVSRICIDALLKQTAYGNQFNARLRKSAANLLYNDRLTSHEVAELLLHWYEENDDLMREGRYSTVTEIFPEYPKSSRVGTD